MASQQREALFDKKILHLQKVCAILSNCLNKFSSTSWFRHFIFCVALCPYTLGEIVAIVFIVSCCGGICSIIFHLEHFCGKVMYESASSGLFKSKPNVPLGPATSASSISSSPSPTSFAPWVPWVLGVRPQILSHWSNQILIDGVFSLVLCYWIKVLAYVSFFSIYRQ